MYSTLKRMKQLGPSFFLVFEQCFEREFPPRRLETRDETEQKQTRDDTCPPMKPHRHRTKAASCVAFGNSDWRVRPAGREVRGHAMRSAWMVVPLLARCVVVSSFVTRSTILTTSTYEARRGADSRSSGRRYRMIANDHKRPPSLELRSDGGPTQARGEALSFKKEELESELELDKWRLVDLRDRRGFSEVRRFTTLAGTGFGIVHSHNSHATLRTLSCSSLLCPILAHPVPCYCAAAPRIVRRARAVAQAEIFRGARRLWRVGHIDGQFGRYHE